MSHHDVLEINQRGGYVLLVEHSNSERNFTAGVFKEVVEKKFAEKYAQKESFQGGVNGKVGCCAGLEVYSSTADADPLRVVQL